MALGFGLTIYTGSEQTFSDVPPSHVFYAFVETAVRAQIVGGYGDGTFRPGNPITRGQLSKIIVIAASIMQGWTIIDPPQATFSDVAVGSTFYVYIETAVCHQIIGGYADGTFRPGSTATRGQISKMVYLAATQP